jgi:hypothetical protein
VSKSVAWFALPLVGVLLGLQIVGFMSAGGWWHGGWDYVWPVLPVIGAIFLAANFVQWSQGLDQPSENQPPKPKRSWKVYLLRIVIRSLSWTLMMTGFWAIRGDQAKPFWTYVLVGLFFIPFFDGIEWCLIKLWHWLRGQFPQRA